MINVFVLSASFSFIFLTSPHPFPNVGFLRFRRWKTTFNRNTIRHRDWCNPRTETRKLVYWPFGKTFPRILLNLFRIRARDSIATVLHTFCNYTVCVIWNVFEISSSLLWDSTIAILFVSNESENTYKNRKIFLVQVYISQTLQK